MKLFWLFTIPFFLFADANDILSKMSLEEKIGQLFVAPICPLHGEEHAADWVTMLQKYHVGNAIVKKADPEAQIRVLNRLQQDSKHPLLILADAEWGLGMRMTGTISFPRNMTLGAIQDLSLLETLGREIAREARAVGIHMNLAPVVDVNINPKNPIIHMRSFGDQPAEVAKRGNALIRGMQEANLLTCVKHFPGHGDTDVDSHWGLPVIRHNNKRLESVEFLPFRSSIQANVDAVMSAHILFPALDQNFPATMSVPILQSLLRDEFKFRGLVVTDALNMRALTDRYSPETIALRAHAAGADLLLYGDHIFSVVDHLLREQIPAAYAALLEAYKKGEFPESRLDESVLKILQVKERLGLFRRKSVQEKPDLATPAAIELKDRLFAEAVTQVGADFSPITKKTAYLSIGFPGTDGNQDAFSLDRCFTMEIASRLRTRIAEFSQVVVSVRQIVPNAPNFGLSPECLTLLQEIAEQTETIICLFGTPYAYSLMPSKASLLIAYEEDVSAQKAVLSILRGEKKAKGILPIQKNS